MARSPRVHLVPCTWALYLPTRPGPCGRPPEPLLPSPRLPVGLGRCLGQLTAVLPLLFPCLEEPSREAGQGRPDGDTGEGHP